MATFGPAGDGQPGYIENPTTGEVTSPPAASGRSESGHGDGPCGPYHFDRSGVRFLLASRLCDAGGACRDLGGEAIGWIAGGGADVEVQE
jgi:hypothetical protein